MVPAQWRLLPRRRLVATRVEGHLTPGLAGAHAEPARAEALWLTHDYPECDGVDVAAQARATYCGEVVVARDLLAVTLRQ